MEITWLGHACFRLRSEEMVVLTDPFPASVGLRPDPRPASVITVSNSHPHHNSWEDVAGEPKLFNAPGEYEYSDMSVRGVMTPLSPEVAREHRNVAYTIVVENVNICHLGDITEPLTPTQIDELSPVDVLLIPAGGGCTLDVDRVLQTLQDLDAKVVIPMHYSVPNLSVPLGTVDAFLRSMGAGEVEQQPRLNLTAANLPPNMRVVVLAPQARAA